jgi:hypothetical protein
MLSAGTPSSSWKPRILLAVMEFSPVEHVKSLRPSVGPFRDEASTLRVGSAKPNLAKNPDLDTVAPSA